MKGARERKKEVVAMVELLGFQCERLDISGSGHIRCYIKDDAGNEFKYATSFSSSSNVRRALLNFKTSVKALSNKAKGLTE